MHLPSLLSYIDPMSGAILIQVITAGAIGCAAFFRQSLWRIIGLAFHSKATNKK